MTASTIRNPKSAVDCRGSVLLMVVVLLTIVAMLGGAFLLVSRTSTQQSRAYVQRAPSDPLAGGMVAIMQKILQGQLGLDATKGPYGDPSVASGPNAWVQFITYPAENAAPLTRNPWLFSLQQTRSEVGSNRTCTLAHLTNWGSLFPVANVTSVTLSGTFDSATNLGTWSGNASDTDGDGWPDSLLFPTGVYSANGDTYYAAIKITDLCALLNINTGGDPNDVSIATGRINPVNVDLKGYLAGIYNGLNQSRNFAPQALAKYNSDVAMRLLAPNDPTQQTYLPFAIGDEGFLRWGGWSPTSGYGRLGNPTGGVLRSLSAEQRSLLTTWNCARALLRHPAADPNSGPMLKIQPLVSDNVSRQATYKQACVMLGKMIGIDPNTKPVKLAAASLVANLQGYQSATFASGSFTPTGEQFTTYSTPDPSEPAYAGVFITRAYAKATVDTSDPPVAKRVNAIEICNLTGKPCSLSGYTIRCGSTGAPYTIAAITLGTAANDRKLVLYHQDTEAKKDPAFFPTSPALVHPAVDTGAFDFDFNKPILLFKTASGAPAIPVPVDQIEFRPSWLSTGLPPAGTVGEEDVRKDDNLADWRFMVANAVKDFAGANLSSQLGLDNGVTAAQVSGNAPYPVQPVMTHAPLRSLADIGRIFLCAPYADASGGGGPPKIVPFTAAICDPNFTLVFPTNDPVRGRMNFKPLAVTAGGYGGGAYPDVPPATALSEFFTLVPPDTTRDDEVIGATKVHTRLYGLINVNTAVAPVMRQLPFPTSFTLGGATFNLNAAELDLAVDYILAYRDKRAVTTGDPAYARNYNPRESADPNTSSGIQGLRHDSNFEGFLTPDEVAVPLANFTIAKMKKETGKQEAELMQYAGFSDARDSLFRAISNLITVRSDTFAANIQLQLRDRMTGSVKQTWHYVAVLDRSNCCAPADRPSVILMTEIK